MHRRTPLTRNTPLKTKGTSWHSSKSKRSMDQEKCGSATTAEQSASQEVDSVAVDAVGSIGADSRGRGLKRKSPLKRTRMKRKKHRKNDDVDARLAYLEEHSNCGICHANWRADLQCHHIVGASGRKEVRANFLTLCSQCHLERYHVGFDLTPGMILSAKMQQDPEGFDVEVILKLLGRNALPERWLPVPLPQWAIDARNAR